MALLKNALHEYATFNYVWTLSALYPAEVNDPSLYKGKIGKLPIISSSGLGNKKTITTLAEDKLESNVEYFIDNVNLNSQVTLSNKNPNTNISNISFKVIEPYSIGLFLQTLSIASQKTGFKIYYNAPHLLTLQFKGFKDDGTYHEVGTKQFVITLDASTMTANESGCIYEFTCVPWNHRALGDLVLQTKTEINIKGSTVAEVLSNGKDSLATTLNERELRNRISNWRKDNDEYQILFPFDISANGSRVAFPDSGLGGVLNDIQGGLDKINNTVAAIGTIGTAVNNLGQTISTIGRINSGAITLSPTGVIERGLNAPEGPESTAPVLVTNVLEEIGQRITEFATEISTFNSPSTVNEIGSSRMIEDFNTFGTVPFEEDGITFVPGPQGYYRRGSMTVSNDTRVYNFAANTPITEIINEIILVSQWGQNLINYVSDGAGMRPWFKIHTKVFIKSMSEVDNIGRPSLRYIFEVIPYYVHESIFKSVFNESNVDVLIDDAVKAYEYMYTGRNRDILNFEIAFNGHYYKIIPSDGTQQNTELSTTVGGPAFANRSPVYAPNVNTASEISTIAGELRSTVGELIELYRAAGGTFIDNSKTRIAQLFKNALYNSSHELQALDLTIRGDPYYLNQSDAGNYVAPPLGPNIDADLSIDINRMDNYILVKFNSPVDYKNNLLLPDPVDQFTGVYRVERVEHIFDNGSFTQVLGMTRINNVSSSSISKLKRVVDAFFKTLQATSALASVLGAETVAGNIQNFMVEAQPFANQLIGLAEVGASLQSVVRGDYGNIGQALVGLESFFTNVQQLESRFRDTVDALRRIDFNNLTPPNSPISVRPNNN